MALNDEQLAILKTELTDDPKSLGYTSDDPECAALLNEIRSGADYQLPNTAIAVSDVLLAIDPDELPSVDIRKMMLFDLFMSGFVDVSESSDTETSIKAIFVGCGNTLASLGALRTRDASRAEILFDVGVSLTHLDVGRARLI